VIPGGDSVFLHPQIATGHGEAWAVSPPGFVAALERDNSELQTVQLRGGLFGVATDSRSAWVTSADGTLSRVSLFSKRPGRPIELGHPAAGVATGFGRVWVAVGR
jgi:hypothetical protein